MGGLLYHGRIRVPAHEPALKGVGAWDYKHRKTHISTGPQNKRGREYVFPPITAGTKVGNGRRRGRYVEMRRL